MQSHPPGLCSKEYAHLAGLLFSYLKSLFIMTEIYSKPSLTYTEQIQHLRDNGMLVHNHEQAVYWLRHVSYYRLSAYWLYFENPKDHVGNRFRTQTSFEDVIALYNFDRDLRRLVMRGTEHVEVALRGSWAYQLSQIGDGHSYLDTKYYSDRKEFLSNLSKLTGEVGRSKETYIKHYRDKYSNPALPPVWMVAEMMSFGQISRWYSNLKDRSLKNRIAEPMQLSGTVLVPLISHLTNIRNICAHHGRLWNRGFLRPPRLSLNPDDLKNSLDLNGTQSPAKLYNTICMIAHIVRTVAPNSSWIQDIRVHLLSHPTNDLAAMGFPDDWTNRPIWQL